MKKILITCAGYPPDIKGGGEKSTQLIAQALSALGHEVTVLTCAASPGERMDSDGKTRVIAIASPNIYWNFSGEHSAVEKLIWHFKDNYNEQAVEQVEKALRDLRPDVVLTSTIENFGPAVWIACSRQDVPVVHVLRSYYLRCFKGTMYANGRNCTSPCAKCRTLTLGRRRATRYVQGVIGISRYILEAHDSLFQSSLKQVIHNPVRIQNELTPLQDGNDGVVFGYLGRIEPEKGIDELLASFSTLPDSCSLVIAGSGQPEYVAYIRDKYRSERIRFLGWVDAAEVYRQIDYVIVPSVWNEPFGRIVVEAYSHGVPVIAAARGGLTELVEEGLTGTLYDADEPGALPAAFLRILEQHDQRSRMREAAFSKAMEFSQSSVGLRYSNFLSQVIKHHRALTGKLATV